LVTDQAIEVAAEGFQQDPKSKSFQEDVIAHVLGAPELCLVYDDSKKCVAFAAFENVRVGDIPVLYLGGLMVKQAYQGKMVMGRLIGAEIARSKPRVVTARTQNPCMLDLMSNLCGDVYPFAGRPQGVSRFVTDHFAENGMGISDPERLVARGVYEGCLYGEAVPRSRHLRVNRFFDERLDYEQGDALFLVGEVVYEG
jgi:hypothetical protein